jgi:nucleotide-binding universal stress UspA family protein
MSIFPTRILFATDGSKDAELAATTAVGLAVITGSEPHVVHTWQATRPTPTAAYFPSGTYLFDGEPTGNPVDRAGANARHDAGRLGERRVPYSPWAVAVWAQPGGLCSGAFLPRS